MAQATNATNRTQNFGLPLFVANDKPSWLVDWNGTMQKLDEVMTEVTETAQTAGQEVTNIESQVQSMQNLVDTLQASVEAAVRDLGQTNATVTEMQNSINTIDATITTLHTYVDDKYEICNSRINDATFWYFDQADNVVGVPVPVGRLIVDKNTGVGYTVWRNTIRKTFTTNGDGSFGQRFIVAAAKNMIHINAAHSCIRIGAGTGTQTGNIVVDATAYYNEQEHISTMCEEHPESNQSIINMGGQFASRPNANVYALITFEYISNEQ